MRISHEEVINFLGQVLNRKKKALEFAQTFAQRNALKHLFGISVVPGQIGSNSISVWDVPVVCWTPSDGGLIRFDVSRYAASAQIIDALAAGQPVALPEAGNSLVVSRGSDEVRGADMDEETDPLENPERYDEPDRAAMSMTIPVEEMQATPTSEPVTGPSRNESADEAAPSDWTEKERKAWNNLLVARKEFPSEYAEALAECCLTDAQVTPGNANEVNSAISRILDREEEA